MNFINDKDTPISYFKDKVNQFVEERNWKKYHTPKNLIQAMSIEIAELSEIFLFKEYTLNDILSNKNLSERISEETADVFIYLVSFINSLNLDLTDIFSKKMLKNKQKYSTDEFKNGRYQKK
jgi:NTP pyrophosphatase (non-canonical NTP hydrolase)